ncbi:terpenoid synthase [Aspergillus eucalypticola CBS 122712]|uniref:Terpenoid synthase n=1 Tax=Aspergillus eucalypticola (strain CBS 122712 / IBT 29274) TaxID=1448314 RepID=A0A317WFF4_ASPEC|nr:terpenoid synthase [Aspergillus eucalypticola CBS 122712]PWY84421.1 terpenoid synthase [Aspergillus eucalypticola CBS 122712]
MTSTMDFVHSHLVEPEEVSKVCATGLPVRRSRYKNLSDEALADFHQKWEEAVGYSFYGGSSHSGSIALFFPPECKPDRIKPYTRLIEYFFARDDMVTASTAGKTRREMPENTAGGVSSPRDKGDMSKVKQIQSEIFRELIEVDRLRGTLLLDSLKKFDKIHDTRSVEDFQSWDAYLDYRCQDMGIGFNLTIIIYCCGLDLTQSDIEMLMPVWWPAAAASALTNDVYSFNREACLEVPSNTNMANAVWYLMKQVGLPVSRAKQLLLEEKIRPLEKQYKENMDAYLSNSSGNRLMTPDVKVFLDMVGLGLSGNW